MRAMSRSRGDLLADLVLAATEGDIPEVFGGGVGSSHRGDSGATLRVGVYIVTAALVCYTHLHAEIHLQLRWVKSTHSAGHKRARGSWE